MQIKKRLPLLLLLAAVEVGLLLSGLGIISGGTLSITILQIPVILAAVSLGLPEGVLISLIFGVGTMLKAGTMDVETVDYLFRDPMLAMAPRMLIAVVTYFVYRVMQKLIDDGTWSAGAISAGISAIVGTFTNTLFVSLVLGLKYYAALGYSDGLNAMLGIITAIMGANTVIEMLVSVSVAALLTPILVGRRYGSNVLREIPLRKSFRKWLSLIIMSAFVVTLSSTYMLQSAQAIRAATKELQQDLNDSEWHIKEHGYLSKENLRGNRSVILLVNHNVIVNAGAMSLVGMRTDKVGLMFPEDMTKSFSATMSGIAYFCKARPVGNLIVVSAIEEVTMFESRNATVLALLLVDSVIFIVIFFLIARILEAEVVNHLYSINASVGRIRAGNLDETVDERTSKEFDVLSDGINSMVDSLKDSMEQIANKMKEELEFARRIQQAALPAADQPDLHVGNYRVAAKMDAAKLVGGDFYDYFRISDTKMGFMIADVSGKGIPASLFMMTAKTVIKTSAQTGKSAAEALTMANNQLCENNDVEMFVTAWLGILDIEKGELEFANAGHNPPLMKPKDGECYYLKDRSLRRGPVLAAMEGIRYRANVIPMNPGDSLFLYTDGVTEANNVQQELYGDDRLLECLRNHWAEQPDEVLHAVRRDVDAFVGEAEQFDDMTMLCLNFDKKSE